MADFLRIKHVSEWVKPHNPGQIPNHTFRIRPTEGLVDRFDLRPTWRIETKQLVPGNELLRYEDAEKFSSKLIRAGAYRLVPGKFGWLHAIPMVWSEAMVDDEKPEVEKPDIIFETFTLPDIDAVEAEVVLMEARS